MNDNFITISFIDARIERMILPALLQPFWYLATIFEVKRGNWKKAHKLVIVNQLENDILVQEQKDKLVAEARKKAYDTVYAQKEEPE